jgi:hypothetical protein
MWVARPVPEDTTHGGADVAGTIEGQSRFIHVVVSNLEEGWEDAADASVYTRTSSEGGRWEQRLLIGGMNPAIAAAGREVYLAFHAYGCDSGLGFLRNPDHGHLESWSAVSCLTKDSRFTSAAIAASGSLVLVTSVDEQSAEVALWVSNDHGQTWAEGRLGSAGGTEPGSVGSVEVAATDHLAAVAWVDRGVTVARISQDAAGHWGNPTPIADGAVRSASAQDSRVAFSGASIADGSPWGQIWTEGGDWRAMSLPSSGPRPHSLPWTTYVILEPPPGVVVAAHSDAEPCALVWWSSADDGATWEPRGTAPGCASDAAVLWTREQQAVLQYDEEQADGYVLWVSP